MPMAEAGQRYDSKQLHELTIGDTAGELVLVYNLGVAAHTHPRSDDKPQAFPSFHWPAM